MPHSYVLHGLCLTPGFYCFFFRRQGRDGVVKLFDQSRLFSSLPVSSGEASSHQAPLFQFSAVSLPASPLDPAIAFSPPEPTWFIRTDSYSFCQAALLAQPISANMSSCSAPLHEESAAFARVASSRVESLQDPPHCQEAFPSPSSVTVHGLAHSSLMASPGGSPSEVPFANPLHSFPIFLDRLLSGT